MITCTLQGIGLLYLSCQLYVRRVVKSILLLSILMSAGSMAISHFIPDVGNYCPLSFFYLFFPLLLLLEACNLKKYIFREPAFLYCFSVIKSMTYAPILFPVPFVLAWGGGGGI